MKVSITSIDDKAEVRVSINCDDVIFVVVDPGPDCDAEAKILYRTSLSKFNVDAVCGGHPGLQLHPAIHTNWDDAVADAQTRIHNLKVCRK